MSIDETTGIQAVDGVAMDPLPGPNDLSSETRALLSRQGVREALRSLGVHPSRRLGQHFLVEPAVLGHVLKAAELGPEDAVLEVGPGLGVLTSELVRRAGHVVAVELDRRLYGWLRERFVEQGSLKLMQGNILKLDPAALMGVVRPYKVVANLPYAVTSAVLRHLLTADPQPTRLVVTVQWEVAKRIAAVPPKMSLLTLSVQYYARPEIVQRVPAGCFYPRPEVNSAVLRLEVSEQPQAVVSPEVFFRLARLGFAHPRRQLVNNLSAGLGHPKEALAAILIDVGVDPQRRAETLSLEEWMRLGQVLLD